MNPRSIQRPSHSQPLTRQDFLPLVETALRVHEFGYARQAALNWLSFYPGDLPVGLLYVQALYGQGMAKQALMAVEKLLLADPEYIDALIWWKKILFHLNQNTGQAEACLYILTGSLAGSQGLPSWVHTLRQRYEWLQHQGRPLATWEVPAPDLENENIVDGLLPRNGDEKFLLSLECIIQVRLIWAQNRHLDFLTNQAGTLQNRWPGCVTLKLVLAQSLMPSDAEKAVAMLHESVVLDTTGQTTGRLWGVDHPYKRLWPTNLEVSPGHATSPQGLAIPAGLAASLGWNQLPPPVFPIKGQASQDTNTPENPAQLKHKSMRPGSSFPAHEHRSQQNARKAVYPGIANLKQAAAKIKQPGLGRVDGRYPVYVLFSTRQGLVDQYGETSAQQILQELHRLSETVTRYRQWGSLVFLADAPDFGPKRTKLQVPAANPADPWALKLALADLDVALALSGEMIGAVLIVGGPEIVPFHNLPNPVDDSDLDVPSDNPYATRDENYFVPEWSLGRLPGDNGSDPAMLLKLLRKITAYHFGFVNEKNWLASWVDWLHTCFAHLAGKSGQKRTSYGYSAAIWRRAALSVFRPIGDPRRLMVCPPIQVQESCTLRYPNKPCLSLPAGRLAYFNLHGMADTDEWYGQRDPNEMSDGPDFPLALRAADISSNGHNGAKNPQVIFSEACYGAHIIDKSADQAISLKLLSSGSQAVVGSTCISYGSISSPLIAADLLGHSFWHYLKDGQPVGEALRRAKIHLAREMHQRQGYLDGEDQKTLLSFILYGDPLVQITELERGPKNTKRPNQRANPVRIVCDREEPKEQLAPVPNQVMAQVKQIVKVYLPGMKDAEIHMTHERAGCQGIGHTCPTASLHMKSANSTLQPVRRVVTLSKTFQEASLAHTQFARLTLDGTGKLVKLVMSR